MTAISTLLYTLTALSQILILLVLFIFIFKRKKLFGFIKKFSYETKLFTFFVALGATLGSLYYSEILSFNPCLLCWYQRIFMYPLVILLGVDLFLKEKTRKSTIILSVIGALIALYHYIVQLSSVFSCNVGGVDCAIRYTFGFGYITIPVMAFTAFLLIAMLSYLNKK
ncbi:MAG: disulfide bond formation protein B [Candidatus Woesearchaeota archaeon]